MFYSLTPIKEHICFKVVRHFKVALEIKSSKLSGSALFKNKLM